MFQLDGKGGLVTPGGLYQRVYDAIVAAGYQVTVSDFREYFNEEPDLSRLPILRPGQDAILAPVLTSTCGVIEAPTGGGKSFLMRTLALLFPTAKIVIATPGKDLVNEHAASMREVFAFDEVGVIGGGSDQQGRRITVATSASLDKVDLEGCDFLIFDEVHRAAAPKTAQALARARRARMYGFSATPYGRGDNADLETEALFGPRIVEKTYQEVQQESESLTDMECFIFDAGGCKEMQGLQGVQLNRHAVWRNKERNQLIVYAIEWAFRQFGEDIQILVAVDTTQHAVYLGNLLPSFTKVYALSNDDKWEMYERQKLVPPGSKPMTSNQREQARLDFKAGKLRRAISTGVWSTGVNFPELSVLVRAEACGNAIKNTQWPGRATRRTDTKDTSYIIDFDDKFERTLEGRAARRLTVYRKKGWKITLMPGLLQAPAPLPTGL